MAEKKKGGNTAAIVRQLAAPIAESLGYILWDVRFVKEGADWFLRIFIDKPGGVGIDDCVAMTGILDESAWNDGITVHDCRLSSRSAAVRLGHCGGKGQEYSYQKY